MREIKFSAGIWYLGAVGDRFAKGGYRPDVPLAQRWRNAAAVDGIAGMEMHYPNEVNEDTIEEVRVLSRETGLQVKAVAPLLWTEPQWRYGALTNPDPTLRKAAIDRAKKTLDIAEALQADLVIYWPAQDGYDYVFQADYRQRFELFVQAMRELLAYKPKQKQVIEYKAYEPRTHIFLGNMGTVLTIVSEIGAPNLGVNYDIGHGLMMREEMAECAALAMRYGKLWHTHFNDNWRQFDDDLIVGSVNFWETLEILFWLDELDYEGWIGLDLFPYREDPAAAMRESIANIRRMYELLEKVDREEIRARWRDSDAIKISHLLRRMLS